MENMGKMILVFLPAASSLTQHLVVESLTSPVAPQTTSYKPLLPLAEGSAF